MGELFRSEEMQLVQLFIQAEAAHDTLDELGRLGLIQFRDVSFLLSLYLSLCLLHFLSKSFLS
jgi:V-type H+-transporting ATPase subunit a